MITCDNTDVPSETMLSKLQWKPLEKEGKSKLFHTYCPISIPKIFTLVNNETYKLSSNNKVLMLSKPKTNAIKKSFSNTAAKTWNTNLRIHISK